MSKVVLLCGLLCLSAAAQPSPQEQTQLARQLRRWARFAELPTSPWLRRVFPQLPRWTEIRWRQNPTFSAHPGLHQPGELSQQREQLGRSLVSRFELEVESPQASRVVSCEAFLSQFGQAWSLTGVRLLDQREQPSSPTSRRELREFGEWVGRSTPLRLSRWGQGDNVTLLFAAIHGDERNTAPLLQKLEGHLEANPEAYAGCTVVVCPVLSAEGWSGRTRANGQGIDPNRNFPFNFQPGGGRGSRPWQTPEALALQHLVQSYRPDKIVAVHAPFDLINYDGPAAELAQEMHRASGQSIAPNLGYPTPGSFGTYAGVYLGIPTITLELPAQGDAWETQREALLRAIRARPDQNSGGP